MNKVEPLKWDSDFFSKNIGKIFLNDDEIEIEGLKEYDLIYVFSDNDNLKYPLVDKKVILTLENIDDLEYEPHHSSIDFFSTTDDYNQLLSLALQSGEHSRFKQDLNFNNSEYEKLYTTWINKSISKELALDIIVKKIDSKIVGFTTISNKSEVLADIGLVAVDQNYRGMGIGDELMKKTIIHAKNLNYKSIQVVTQLDNIPAMKLYEKAGFKISLINYIYHIWINDTI